MLIKIDRSRIYICTFSSFDSSNGRNLLDTKKIRISFESCHDRSMKPTERVMKASCKYIFAYGKFMTVIYKTLYISCIHNKRNKNNHYSHMNYSNSLSASGATEFATIGCGVFR